MVSLWVVLMVMMYLVRLSGSVYVVIRGGKEEELEYE